MALQPSKRTRILSVSQSQYFNQGGTAKPPAGLIVEVSRFNGFYVTEATMNGLIYLIGLIVVIMFILSFLGLR
jgi:predicted membrane channel-forming protein YqfA (hemolysin III family)